MKNRHLLARWMPCIALAATALQGCELAVIGAAGGAAYSIVEDRRSSGVQIDDETIQLRVQSRVSDRFGDKVHLTVTSFNRMALLTGEAPDESARAEITKIVEGVPNVRAITNEVQIAIPTPRASRINDELITSKVKGRLIDSGKASPVHVKVVTEAGVVYLMGVVSEQEAADAVDIARTTSGVRKVVKIFEYCRTNEEICKPRPKEPAAPPSPKPGS
ncbi:MAG: BON domain-containing protein [Stellaceae bacterium]